MKTPPPSLTELLPRQLIGRIQANVAAMLGGAIVTFRADGGAFTDLYAVSPYCRQILSTPDGQSLCTLSRRDLAMEAIQTGEAQQAHCHAGVHMIAVPLILNGEAVAVTVASLSPSPESPDAPVETSRNIALDPRTLTAAARHTSPLSLDRQQSAVRLLEDLNKLYGLHLAAAQETDTVRHQMAESARRMKALYNSTRAMSSTLSLEQLSRVLVEQMAMAAGLDRCLLTLLEAKGQQGGKLRLVGHHGLLAQEIMRFQDHEVLDFGIQPDWWERLSRGRAVMLPLGWLLQTPMKDALTSIEDRRALLVPVVNAGTLWAIAYLDGVRSADTLMQAETDLALAIAGQAGIAFAHVTRFQQEERVARTLQENLLKTIPTSIGNYSVGSLYEPALAEAQVGGDFYDFIPLDASRYAVLIGDVSGKGVEAAVHTGMMKYMVRGLIVDDPEPGPLVSRLNRAVVSMDSLGSSFVTFFYALLDSAQGRIIYTNAGHEPPLLYHTYLSEARELPPSGPAIGLMPDFDYPQEERSFREGDSLLLYTDGAVEARNPEGDFFGMDGVQRVMHRTTEKSGPEIVAMLQRELQVFTGGRTQDDLALLAIRCLKDTRDRTVEIPAEA